MRFANVWWFIPRDVSWSIWFLPFKFYLRKQISRVSEVVLWRERLYLDTGLTHSLKFEFTKIFIFESCERQKLPSELSVDFYSSISSLPCSSSSCSRWEVVEQVNEQKIVPFKVPVTYRICRYWIHSVHWQCQISLLKFVKITRKYFWDLRYFANNLRCSYRRYRPNSAFANTWSYEKQIDNIQLNTAVTRAVAMRKTRVWNSEST